MANPNPIEIFRDWYAAAKKCGEIVDASAMALATADNEGKPTVRMVLLKHFDEHGFVFYTNLRSRKARDIEVNPHASLCFHWAPQRRQIRISGNVESIPDVEADAYFATRPRLSQLGAWASEQSSPMAHRFVLETKVATGAAQFGVGEIPRPAHWSGFRLVPSEIEFWTERPFRHHERAEFIRDGDGWQKQWLFP